MALTVWALAAVGAGALGWLGPFVIRRLPESPDAEPDAPSYPAVAAVPRLSVWLAAGAIALVTIVWIAVPGHLLPAWVALCGVGTWLFYIDWRMQLLPTRLIGPLYVVMLVLAVAEAWGAGDWGILVRAVVASAVAYAVFWVFWWVSGVWRPGSFGFGDVRFSAPLGLALGSVGVGAAVVGLYLGILIGGVAGLVLKSRGRRHGLALGPWMLLGAVLGPFA
ncbi:MAG TPA: A24 family peptidase [Aeromicrobium sp.]|nr:A24 family peptidase [Aeromicrobium sp.]